MEKKISYITKDLVEEMVAEVVKKLAPNNATLALSEAEARYSEDTPDRGLRVLTTQNEIIGLIKRGEISREELLKRGVIRDLLALGFVDVEDDSIKKIKGFNS